MIRVPPAPALLLLALLWSEAPAREAAAPVLPSQAGIASASAQATDAGLEVIAAGGNAFDAAVAVSAALGLVEPESSGLGGGGFMLLRVADEDGQPREVFVDARERAPAAAHKDMYLDGDGEVVAGLSTLGPLAAGIPGLPAGLVHLAERYGRLPLSESLAPAIRLAREGWVFGSKNAAMTRARHRQLAGNEAAAALFLVDGEVPEVGSLLRNPDYARTLELLAEHGFDGFYRGEQARRLVAGVNAAGGIWSADDLAAYRVVEREPLTLQYRGYRMVTAPPPSSGGIALAAMFNILSGYDLREASSVQRAHLSIEAMRRAYRDRAIYLGDPDFVPVPVDLLTSDTYAAGLRAGIHPARATPSELLPGVESIPERPHTTHFSVVDTEGNVAAVTQTVNLIFGATFAVEGTGFVLNNEMDDFSTRAGVPDAFGLVGGDANAIEPGKRPLSSMTPTFLIGDGRLAALGTPGGSRIITMVLLGLKSLMDGGSAQEAADRPRYHHQYLPDTVSVEPDTFSDEEIQALEARGHRVEVRDSSWGNMQVVTWDQRSGEVEAGSDRRWEGVGKGATSQAGSIYR